MPRLDGHFRPAGHILGAASLLLEVAGRRILFSGDLGRPDDLAHEPARRAPAADTVLIESTYGDREPPRRKTCWPNSAPALQRLAARGGVAVVPVFAVGRAQAMLHAIALLKAQGELPHSAAGVPGQPDGHPQHPSVRTPPGRTPPERAQVPRADALRHHGQHAPTNPRPWRAATAPWSSWPPAAWPPAGACCTTWRTTPGNHRNMIILTGYQAPGTRGATLASGAKTVRIHGQDVDVQRRGGAAAVGLGPCRCQPADGLAAHHARSRRDQVYVVHGEIGRRRHAAPPHRSTNWAGAPWCPNTAPPGRPDCLPPRLPPAGAASEQAQLPRPRRRPEPAQVQFDALAVEAMRAQALWKRWRIRSAHRPLPFMRVAKSLS